LKYLLWALLLYLAWRWFSASGDRQSRRRSNDDAAPHASPGSGAERMIECAECGVHFPLSEALPGTAERFFCSEAHRDKRQSH
jgi:uncharacterized protein